MKAFVIVLFVVVACTGSIDDPGATVAPPDSIDRPGSTPDIPHHSLTPDRNPIGDNGTEPGRSIRRLSASQLARSIEVATGRSWRKYNQFAGALGEPDLEEVTEEDRSIGASFEKLVEDAARDTCVEAVNADLSSGSQVILRHAGASDRSEASQRENLKYLILRFWGERVTRDDDQRLAPWMNLLRASEPADDDAMAARWQAVCVGLITHPNFLTY